MDNNFLDSVSPVSLLFYILYEGMNIKECIFNIDGFGLKACISGHGLPVIVIGSSQYYMRTFSENLRKKLQLIFIDTRVFTKDDLEKIESDFTLDKIVSDIEIIRRKLGVNQFCLIGHSIHAFIAIEYTTRYGANVSHLVLIGSSPIVGPELYKEADRYFDESADRQRKEIFANDMKKFSVSNSQSFVGLMISFRSKLWYNRLFDAQKLLNDVEN